MSLWLFWQFGSNPFTASLLCLCGAAVETFKILSLLRWKNQVTLKKKRKNYTPLLMYILIAIASCFASMAFGVKEIEKVAISQMGNTGKGDVILMRISQLRKQAGHKNTGYIAGLKKQIEDLRKQIPTRGFKVVQKTKEINAEISKLNALINRNSQVKDNSKIHNEIERLKIQLADIKFNSIDSKGAFAVMADVFGITVNTIMIIFLAFVTIIIEVGIASTSAGISNTKKKKAKKKKKQTYGQLSLLNMVA
jgi:hypothetical protein